jgi:hypothetical protein
MARDVISTCPVCANELTITRLQCRGCGTSLEGEFGVGRFGRLAQEQLTLLESFLRSRGNLREMERDLGISYPTIRGRLDTLVRTLGLADGEAAPEPPVEAPTPGVDVESATTDVPAERRQILERLARRELSAEDAAAALRALGAAER